MQTAADIIDQNLKEGGYRRKARTGAVMLSILQALDGGAETSTEIAKETGRDPQRVASMLQVLKTKGAVEVIGKRKSPHRGPPLNIYQLTPKGRYLTMYLQHILQGGVSPERLLSPDQITHLLPEITSRRFRGREMLDVFRLMVRGLSTSSEIAAAMGWTVRRTNSFLYDAKRRGLIRVVGNEKQSDGHWLNKYQITTAGRRWMLYLDKKISILEQGERLLRDKGCLQADQSTNKATSIPEMRGSKV